MSTSDLREGLRAYVRTLTDAVEHVRAVDTALTGHFAAATDQGRVDPSGVNVSATDGVALDPPQRLGSTSTTHAALAQWVDHAERIIERTNALLSAADPALRADFGAWQRARQADAGRMGHLIDDSIPGSLLVGDPPWIDPALVGEDLSQRARLVDALAAMDPAQSFPCWVTLGVPYNEPGARGIAILPRIFPADVRLVANNELADGGVLLLDRDGAAGYLPPDHPHQLERDGSSS